MKEDVTIKLSHSIDVDKDDRNGELARVYVRVCALLYQLSSTVNAVRFAAQMSCQTAALYISI